MSEKEDRELNKLLSESPHQQPLRQSKRRGDYATYADEPPTLENKMNGSLVQWTSSDGKRFIPASHTKETLIPGAYEIQHSSQVGIYFEKIPVKTEGLLNFPQTNSEKIIQEIQNFWDREDIFKKYKLSYKRGIMLWGVPGGGKSSTIQIVMKDVVERDGIVVKFTSPHMFSEGMRILREIQPATPVVVLMEDIDSILEKYNESEVLNILDGIDQIEKVIFLATTNYPERLGARILNRPSRFDKRFKISYPNKESRKLYFNHLIKENDVSNLNIDIDKWVADTSKFSVAHLKELFIAVVILGDEYKDALTILKSMKEDITSDHDDGKKSMGFLPKDDGDD